MKDLKHTYILYTIILALTVILTFLAAGKLSIKPEETSGQSDSPAIFVPTTPEEEPTLTPPGSKNTLPTSATLPVPVVHTNAKTGWKLYTNEKYHYSVEYPPDWTLEVDGITVWENWVPHPEMGDRIIFWLLREESIGGFKQIVDRTWVGISIDPNLEKLSLLEWLKVMVRSKYIDLPGPADPLEGFTWEAISFGNYPALKVYRKETPDLWSLYIDRKIDVVSFGYGFDSFRDPPTEIPLDVINAMVSTLTIGEAVK